MSLPAAPEALEAAPPRACPWLDALRTPSGGNGALCRLTGHAFGPPAGALAACLKVCAYPAQHARPRCAHMNLGNVVLTQDGALPRIHCVAHGSYDAPRRCATCRDYTPA
ncbi:MAG TPA: hypothetical protein VMV93_05425 [Chloroflexota bacterium]|nr:hypothetical protein [Chloroflexota bacterium]